MITYLGRMIENLNIYGHAHLPAGDACVLSEGK